MTLKEKKEKREESGERGRILTSTVSVRTVALKLVTKPIRLNRPSGLSHYHLGGPAGWTLPPQDRSPFSPLSSLFCFSSFNVNRLLDRENE